ncbi:MAG: hypothetical protein A2428_02580 [Bdellovibrionales bacterium RIFOXYC1_FULL_54_43]|nr:MAG: hypothetical protein A2428_02580 [Bdellovibrionales bacterium RIFOXYC1_FULL_54_43]OFZ82572.1 MAG: hypothetical protein A2603_15035 [Bdellovibrionales bacterium RIFOXYD1_FULL_55_31]
MPLVKLAEETIVPSDEERSDYFRPRVLKVIVEYGLLEDPAKWCGFVETFAEKAQASRHYDKARDYWEEATRLASYSKNLEKEKAFKERLTASFVEEARSMRADGASAMLLSDRYTKAIEACRRHGGKRALIDELHQEMNAIHQRLPAEMKRIETSVDVTDLVKAARAAVEDCSLEDAIARIAVMAIPPRKTSLRAEVEEASKKFVFMNLLSAVSYNDKGRVVARTAPVIASDEETRDAGTLAQMLIQCVQHQAMVGISRIEAARETLSRRCPSDTPLFDDLVTMNPFVPQGREDIFVRGLKAGLRGDHLVCAHLLIPQIENSVRVNMERSGLLVTRLTDEQTQKEHDLNTLLYKDETEKVFGEDLVFSMRALLVEEVGANFRNKLSHGLLGSDQFHGGIVNYLWALTIRLCWLGKLLVKRSDAPSHA